MSAKSKLQSRAHLVGHAAAVALVWTEVALPQIKKVEPASCPEALLAEPVRNILRASSLARPIYKLVLQLADRSVAMYHGVAADAKSRAEARTQHAGFEALLVEQATGLGSKLALEELASVFSDEILDLSTRRNALRLWVLMRGYQAPDSQVMQMGRKMIYRLASGTDTSNERMLLHDLWVELKDLRHASAQVYVRTLLGHLLDAAVDGKSAYSSHSHAYRSAFFKAVLANANRDAFQQLSAQLMLLPEPTRWKMSVELAECIDQLLDDSKQKDRLSRDLIHLFTPLLAQSLGVTQARYGISIESPHLPAALYWDSDWGVLRGLLHYATPSTAPKPLHPGHFFALLLQKNWQGPFTPAQRYLIRNFSQAIMVGRVATEALAEVRTEMETVLERLQETAAASPPFNFEHEMRVCSEYTDIRLLLHVLPWSICPQPRKAALLQPLLDDTQYGKELSDLAREILGRP